MSAIPTKSRDTVRERSGGRCERCGGQGGHYHHRRRRRVTAGHDPHCPCNGVYLCRVCHAWAHANPQSAVETGFIIGSHELDPGSRALEHSIFGWCYLQCDGTYRKEEQ